MSTLHSAFSTSEQRYLQGYTNRTNGRELVRELIEDIVTDRLETLERTDRLHEVVPHWASAHPIALLENEFDVEIRQHDSPVEPEST